LLFVFCFFFSSRRRHTRFSRDWSSDVCSSDLDNISSFNSGEYNENIFTTTVNTNESGKANFEFELKYPEWGRYLVRVEDPNGGQIGRASCRKEGRAWGQR